MKIVLFGPARRTGALHGDRIVDLNLAAARAGAGVVACDLPGLIDGGPAAIESAHAAVEHALENDPAGVVHSAYEVALHAPWPRKRIVCAGGNYAEHSYGMALNRGVQGITLEGMAKKIRADGQWGFWKTLDDVAGHGTAVPYPARVEYFDYEGEVVVILGKRGKNVPAGKIADHVWGVTLGNDWSNRDNEPAPARPVSYNLMKNFDYSASIGPCIVVGELDPQHVEVETRVDGVLRQQYNSKDMVFSFGELLEFLSRDFTFVPGDAIFGGTGAGTAQDKTKAGADGKRPHDLFLRPGQTVEVSSPKIGTLTNTIAAV